MDLKPGQDITNVLQKGGTLELPEGEFLALFRQGDKPLPDWTTLVGKGMDVTSIKLPDGSIIPDKKHEAIVPMLLRGSKGVKLVDLSVDGNKYNQKWHNTQEQDRPPGSWHGTENGGWHAIQGAESKNLTLVNVKMKNGGTDGLCLGDGVENFRATTCNFKNNRRQGINITKANACIFDHCKIWQSSTGRVSGQNPGAGVDLEPNNDQDDCFDIQFLHTVFQDCRGAGFMLDNRSGSRPTVEALLFDGCTFVNQPRSLELKGRNARVKSILVRNSTIWGNVIVGGSGGDTCLHENTRFEGNDIKGKVTIRRAAKGSKITFDPPLGKGMLVDQGDSPPDDGDDG